MTVGYSCVLGFDGLLRLFPRPALRGAGLAYEPSWPTALRTHVVVIVLCRFWCGRLGSVSVAVAVVRLNCHDRRAVASDLIRPSSFDWAREPELEKPMRSGAHVAEHNRLG